MEVVLKATYSGTSHNGLSEIRMASMQRTNHMSPIGFGIEVIHFQPPRDADNLLSSDNLTEHMPPKDKWLCKIASKNM